MHLFKKGPLSNRDFKKEYGKNIFIYPFKEQNLKGSTYNLTASSCAWIEDTDSAHREYKLIVDKDGDISIPPGKTAIIETDESIYVTGKICGTYNSKVKLCSKGLEHIGTTLDPYYFGTSAIPLHNDTNKPLKIKKNETIVSIMFFYTNRKADNLHDNTPFRNDIFGSINIESFYEGDESNSNDKASDDKSSDDKNQWKKEILEQISSWKECPWRNNRMDLERQVKKFIKKNDCYKILLKRVFITIAASILAIVLLSAFMCSSDKDGTLYDILKTLIAVTVPSASLIIGVLYKSYETNKAMEMD